MILLLCVDDNNGTLFNRRRQSQDRLLRQRVLEMAGETALWMNSYSAKQFDSLPEGVAVDEAFLAKAGPGELCFVENTDVSPFLSQAERIVLFRWNRTYPADRHFVMPAGFRLAGTEEFPGSSHEKITQEVYER